MVIRPEMAYHEVIFSHNISSHGGNAEMHDTSPVMYTIAARKSAMLIPPSNAYELD